ncbi:MAG: hypothetical protein EOP50_05465 [Sphingobacteriales bacterium]|nr:MAG: hypothetical protein EOP50_05465 [Sphingobacteriales bacterium]
MFRSIVLACFCAVMFSLSASAQLGKIPSAVTDSFTRQYPQAKQVSYGDNLGDYSVRFLMDTSKMIAHYNRKGVWQGSDKTITFESLSNDVKDGFMKSKFSDWQVREVMHLYLTPEDGGGEQFRVKVSKGDLKRRYLYFNRSGRLVRDKMAL